MPFLGCTIDQVYHLRPAEDYSGPGIYFMSFTFIAVDEEALGSAPWQRILCGKSWGRTNGFQRIVRLMGAHD